MTTRRRCSATISTGPAWRAKSAPTNRGAAASKAPAPLCTTKKRPDEPGRGRQECLRQIAGARVFMGFSGPAGPVGTGRSACATSGYKTWESQ